MDAKTKKHKKSKQSSLLESSVERKSSIDKKKKKKKDKKEKKRKHSGSKHRLAPSEEPGLAETASKRGMKTRNVMEKELQKELHETIEKINRLMDTQN